MGEADSAVRKKTGAVWAPMPYHTDHAVGSVPVRTAPVKVDKSADATHCFCGLQFWGPKTHGRVPLAVQDSRRNHPHADRDELRALKRGAHRQPDASVQCNG